jgi:hypothetical protein
VSDPTPADDMECGADGWRYTGELGGIHESRHEAIGAAAVAARERWERRKEIAPDKVPDTPPVLEATERVYAFKPHLCDACGETFLRGEDLRDHHPCEAREPTPAEPATAGGDPR